MDATRKVREFSWSRRDVMRLVAGSGLALAACQRGADPDPGLTTVTTASGTSPQIPSWETGLRELAPNIYAYVQGGGPGISNASVSNAGVIVGPDHLMIIDTLAAPLHTQAFIGAVRDAFGSKPFRHVINTHHHGDHVNGNQYFLPAEIIAHPFCREMMLKSDPPPVWEAREGWSEGNEPRRVTPPVTTFTEKMIFHYGDTLVELLHLGIGHTWSDVLIHLPQHKVLFAGDVAFHYVVPTAWQGHVSRWLDVLAQIQAMDVEMIVPGHGPIGGKGELAEMGEYYELLRREARERFDAGMTPGQAAADIDMGRFATWNNPERIVTNTVRLYAEFDGSITPENDREGTRRATEEYGALIAARTE